MRPRISFRADGSTRIGMGHIFRCISLAGMLKDEFDCQFLVKEPDHAVRDIFVKENLPVQSVPAFNTVSEEADHLLNNCLEKGQILVLDGYHFTEAYRNRLGKGGITVAYIDDLATGHYSAELVINHAFGTRPEQYDKAHATRLLLGASYALLRPPFIQACKRERQLPEVNRVFINMGGSDQHNLTRKALDACLISDKVKEITIVTGSAYPHQDLLVQAAEDADKPVTILRNLSADEMIQAISGCSVAICPASSISLELSAVGIGLLFGLSADNQLNIYNGLVEGSVGNPVGDLFALSAEELAGKIDVYLSDRQRLELHLTNQKAILDGRSPERFREAFAELAVK